MIWILLLIGAVVLLTSSKGIDAPTQTPVSDNVASPTVYKTVELTRNSTKQEIMNAISSGSLSTPTSPVVIARTPPPGYSGPVNGPFYWAGVGEPPDGKQTSMGNPVYAE
jgi:hypothetical protein